MSAGYDIGEEPKLPRRETACRANQHFTAARNSSLGAGGYSCLRYWSAGSWQVAPSWSQIRARTGCGRLVEMPSRTGGADSGGLGEGGRGSVG